MNAYPTLHLFCMPKNISNKELRDQNISLEVGKQQEHKRIRHSTLKSIGR
jgi:hypothetical protein